MPPKKYVDNSSMLYYNNYVEVMILKKEEIIENLAAVLDLINTNVKEEAKKCNTDINSSQACVLNLIMKNGGSMKVADIIAYKKKRKTTVTEILKALEEKGYITKCQCNIDSREKYASATAKLEQEIETIQEMAKKVINNIYKDFSEGEKIILNELLEKIENNLKK